MGDWVGSVVCEAYDQRFNNADELVEASAIILTEDSRASFLAWRVVLCSMSSAKVGASSTYPFFHERLPTMWAIM